VGGQEEQQAQWSGFYDYQFLTPQQHKITADPKDILFLTLCFILIYASISVRFCQGISIGRRTLLAVILLDRAGQHAALE
jgi:hypothetical protein